VFKGKQVAKKLDEWLKKKDETKYKSLFASMESIP
jgi:hypothetical protein